jgi:hypothetical protein
MLLFCHSKQTKLTCISVSELFQQSVFVAGHSTVNSSYTANAHDCQHELLTCGGGGAAASVDIQFLSEDFPFVTLHYVVNSESPRLRPSPIPWAATAASSDDGAGRRRSGLSKAARRGARASDRATVTVSPLALGKTAPWAVVLPPRRIRVQGGES